jgi:hypothetical protein
MPNEDLTRNELPKTTYPIHFEDFSGQQFEWQVYAFIERQRDSLAWLGQTGNDDGRDIWGTFDGKSHCYQCANYQKLTEKKAEDDIDKLIQENKKPDHFNSSVRKKSYPRDRENSLDTLRPVVGDVIW